MHGKDEKMKSVEAPPSNSPLSILDLMILDFKLNYPFRLPLTQGERPLGYFPKPKTNFSSPCVRGS